MRARQHEMGRAHHLRRHHKAGLTLMASIAYSTKSTTDGRASRTESAQTGGPSSWRGQRSSPDECELAEVTHLGTDGLDATPQDERRQTSGPATRYDWTDEISGLPSGEKVLTPRSERSTISDTQRRRRDHRQSELMPSPPRIPREHRPGLTIF